MSGILVPVPAYVGWIFLAFLAWGLLSGLLVSLWLFVEWKRRRTMSAAAQLKQVLDANTSQQPNVADY